MKAIEILSRCRDAPAEIRRTEQRIWQRKNFAASSPALGGRVADEISALEQQLRAQRERSAIEKAAACALLDRLNAKESAVLYGYYIDGLTVAGLARKLHYSEGYVRRLRRQAEGRMARIPEEEAEAQLPAWYRKETEHGG